MKDFFRWYRLVGELLIDAIDNKDDNAIGWLDQAAQFVGYMKETSGENLMAHALSDRLVGTIKEMRER